MSGKCGFQWCVELGCGVRAEEDVVFFGRNHVYGAVGGWVAQVTIPLWVRNVYFFVEGVCVVVAMEVFV